MTLNLNNIIYIKILVCYEDKYKSEVIIMLTAKETIEIESVKKEKLYNGIRQILDGEAVIIMGSGASYGAKNALGNFPSASALSKELYKKCNIIPDNENDLQDAAQCFEEAFSAHELITEIRTIFNCVTFSESHETIYMLPWMRYYTTNYDDVALLSTKKNGKKITPVTLTSDLKTYSNFENLCIHINGYIGDLNEATLHNEFKLTLNSYLSQTNILNSQWGDYFINDLESAKCIIILGLSLNYDLDLKKIIFNADLAKKTLIIDCPDLSADAERKLNRFGEVYKIGVDTFAAEINEVQKTYSKHLKLPTDIMYTSFIYEYKRQYEFTRPNPEDIFQLFLNGCYSDHLFYKEAGLYCGLINRKVFSEIKHAVLDGKKVIFIHSDMGNGKTACLNELRYSLSKEDIHIFTLENPDFNDISKEISAICSLSKHEKVLIIIDDYPNYMEILYKFSLLGGDKIQFVLTARTALNYNKMPIVLDEFNVKEGYSSIFDINRLDRFDIENCIRIFNEYGLFGKSSKLSFDEKVSYLTERKGGASRFQSIMLGVLHSNMIEEKIKGLVNIIKKESMQYYNVVILILIVKIMNLRLSAIDLERIADVDITTDALFKSNPAIKELLIINYKNMFTIKSPVTAKYILKEVSNPKSIITAMCELALYAAKYSDSPKYFNVLMSIVSYSHINSFLRDFRNQEQFLLEYYDELSKIDYYVHNNFFWLQYAISCIEMKKFDRAQYYLDTAYGLIPDNFVPFQINNQQARLYLEKIVQGQTQKASDDFIAAHKLLMLPIDSTKDNEYNVIRLFGYYCRKKICSVMLTNENKKIFRGACREAYERTANFIKKNPLYIQEIKEIESHLLSLCFSDNS